MALLYFSLFIGVISYVGTVCYGNKVPVDEFTKAFRDIDADRDDKITLEEVSYFLVSFVLSVFSLCLVSNVVCLYGLSLSFSLTFI